MSDIVYKNLGFSTPFLRGYRELRIPVLDSNGIPVWPELFPIERIDALRETVGFRHFSSQMMLEYVPPDRARLDPDALHLYSDEFEPRTSKIGDKIVTGYSMYWDPSSGKRQSDGSVCVLIYRDDSSKRIFIHDVMYITVPDTTLHPLAYQCDAVIDFCKRHNVGRLSIETNGLGNALPEIMYDVSARRGEKIYVQKVVNTKNKESRILDAIEPVLSTGRLYANTRIQQTPLISEMIGWMPFGGIGHDDGLDAVAGAISAIPNIVRPVGSATKIFNANTNFRL